MKGGEQKDVDVEGNGGSRVLDDAERLFRSELRETLRKFRGELLRFKELLAKGVDLKGKTIRAIGEDVGGVEGQRINIAVQSI